MEGVGKGVLSQTILRTHKTIGEGIKFEHRKRMCCRFVDSVENLPLKSMREEVRDRVIHCLDTQNS